MARSELQTADKKARSGLAAFKSSGVHVLGAYISPPESRDTLQPNSDAQCLSHGALAEASAGSNVWTGHIPADNVGFRLLCKAGWNVGTGLGAGKQGRREPIETVVPKGTRGLGFDPCAAQQQQQDEHMRRKRSSSETAGGGTQPQPGRRRGPAGDRVAALVQQELAAEGLGDKVARHRQLMSAEREQQRGRDIERYIRSAFNDPFDSIRSDNSNPLSRPHRLTGSNPLLDTIRD